VLRILLFQIYEFYDKDYNLARIDKKNEDWFFNVILSSMMRVDKIIVDWQGLTRKIMIDHKKHKDR